MKQIPCCAALALLLLAGSVTAEETPGFQCMVRRTLLDVLGDEINETTEVNDEILGTVVSGTGHLQAALSIVPLRIGGGSRLKICEALAMRRPIVSMPGRLDGLEGLEWPELFGKPAHCALDEASRRITLLVF